MTSDRHTLAAPQGAMAWRQWGTEGPLLVLLHGVGLNADVWAPQADALAGTHRIRAIDLPGHGGSAALAPDATLDDFVAQVIAVLTALDGGPVLLAGHSMGALVALGVALDAPAQVAGVAALSAVHCRSAAARAAAEGRADLLEQTGIAATIAPTIARWLGTSDTAHRGGHAGTLRAMLEAADPEGYARAYRIFATGDRAHEGRLERLAMPALFLTGADDPNSTPAMARAMADAAPQGRAVTVPDARHMVGFVSPAPVNAALRDFSARVFPSGRRRAV
jgi:(E)-2-((N-methylformamido)methylene)succinate hydrolase